MIFRWKLEKFQTNYPQLARVLHLYLTSRNKNKSDKYDSIDKHGRFKWKNGTNNSWCILLQRAKRSTYTTRRSCWGNLARSSRTTFGWSVVSFISVCCLRDCVVGSREQGWRWFFRWMEIIFVVLLSKWKEYKRILKRKNDLHWLIRGS